MRAQADELSEQGHACAWLRKCQPKLPDRVKVSAKMQLGMQVQCFGFPTCLSRGQIESLKHPRPF